jgi:prepilin-type N-terminal cleavage/methylation domain-containing protein
VVSRRWLRTNSPDRRGFTLIETMVAITVFSIGLLGLAAMLPLLKADVTRSDQRTRAVILAEETTEWLRGLAYADSSLDAGAHADPDFPVANYERSWSVLQDDPITGVKRVTVVVNRIAQPAESARIMFLHAQAGR